jgi:hypothetical protein
MTDNNKDTGLLYYEIYDSRKKFYDAGSGAHLQGTLVPGKKVL